MNRTNSKLELPVAPTRARVAWRFFVDDVDKPRTGAYNMAVDHALLEQAQREKTTMLRFYRWDPACLSFGRNQPAQGLYDPAAAQALGMDIVRRPTGGLAVLHDRELTYAVIAPCDLLGGPRESYFIINRALVSGLRALGVPAEISAGVKRSPFGTMHPCFAEPASGEVVANGRKLVGSAQRCEKRTLLQHGSILLDGDQHEVASIASVPFDLTSRATSLRQLLGTVPELGKVVRAFAAGFEEVCGTSLAPSSLSRSEARRVEELTAIYRSAEWTWRR